MLALGVLPANAVRDRMEEGREALLEGRGALLEGDPAAASRAFAEAEARFVQARSHAGNPLLRFAGWVPLLGRTPDAALHLAAAGREVAIAGRAISDGLSALPGGLGSLGPREGRIPVEAFESFAPSVQSAAAHLRIAETEVGRVKTTWLLGPVADARTQFERELTPLRRGLEASSLIVSRFPAFLGADGPRRYLFAAENPAELRGTGGLVGSVAVMTADRGRLTFSPFEANEAFPRLPRDAVEPPNADYARRYPDGAGFMLVANLTPDFPSAGVALERLYEASRDAELDGAIAADPFALQAMLSVSGGVQHPVLGTVTNENVVALLTNRAYALVPDSTARNAVLGDVAQTVLGRFLDGAPPAEAAEVLARAAGEGHLTIVTADPEFQRGIRLAGADGGLPDPAPRVDVIGAFVNNGGANKVDYFAERTLDYRVSLGAGGATNATVWVEIHNGAPTSGQPTYVIGPNSASARGENVSLLDLFVPAGTELLEVTQDGQGASAGEASELGYAVFPTSLEIPSGETSRVEYRLGRTGAWTGTTSRGSYRLVLLGQTTLIPTRARVEIRVPEGATVVGAGPEMDIQDDRVIWEGTLGSSVTLDVVFQKPLPARMWDAITGFFSKRLLEF